MPASPSVPSPSPAAPPPWPPAPTAFARAPVEQEALAFYGQTLRHEAHLTPQQLADECGATAEYIIAAIECGHLLAKRLPSTGEGGKDGGDKRPRYKIARADATLFLARIGTGDRDTLHDTIANALPRLSDAHLRALARQIAARLDR